MLHQEKLIRVSVCWHALLSPTRMWHVCVRVFVRMSVVLCVRAGVQRHMYVYVPVYV